VTARAGQPNLLDITDDTPLRLDKAAELAFSRRGCVMPRRVKPPRLYLRRAIPGIRSAVWVILDNRREVATTCRTDEEGRAQEILIEYCEQMRREKPKRETYYYGFVYFITIDDVRDYPIKVGYSEESVQGRLNGLQTGCPRVMGEISGTVDTEKAILIRFARQRMEGEWLRRSPALMEFIKTITVEPGRVAEEKREAS
jgi:hypothetical protein